VRTIATRQGMLRPTAPMMCPNLKLLVHAAVEVLGTAFVVTACVVPFTDSAEKALSTGKTS
jgi:hypothetical protein